MTSVIASSQYRATDLRATTVDRHLDPGDRAGLGAGQPHRRVRDIERGGHAGEVGALELALQAVIALTRLVRHVLVAFLVDDEPRKDGVAANAFPRVVHRNGTGQCVLRA